MANPSTAPFGLRPVRKMDGTPWNGQTIRCYIASTYATALFIGDPVVFTTTTADRDTTAKHPSIKIATAGAGNIVRGVITSFEPNPTNLSRQYSPASTEGWANVCIATPDIVFQIRDDGGGTPDKNWPTANAVLGAGSGGSTITGLSSWIISAATTPANTQNYQLQIIALADTPDNELGDYAIWDVLINTSRETAGTFDGTLGA